MTHFLRHDPAEALRRVRCPILALGGSRDIQVEAAPNLATLKAAAESGGNRQVETRIYEGLNHLFQPCSTGAVGEYGQIRQTMDEQVGVSADGRRKVAIALRRKPEMPDIFRAVTRFRH